MPGVWSPVRADPARRLLGGRSLQRGVLSRGGVPGLPAWAAGPGKELRATAGCRTAVVSRGRLVEVGCAFGFFLNLAREHFEVKGFEVNAEAATYARESLGLDVEEGEFLANRLGDDSVDVAMMWDVIEPPRATGPVNRQDPTTVAARRRPLLDDRRRRQPECEAARQAMAADLSPHSPSFVEGRYPAACRAPSAPGIRRDSTVMDHVLQALTTQCPVVLKVFGWFR